MQLFNIDVQDAYAPQMQTKPLSSAHGDGASTAPLAPSG
jgi:hypothetical protein